MSDVKKSDAPLDALITSDRRSSDRRSSDRRQGDRRRGERRVTERRRNERRGEWHSDLLFAADDILSSEERESFRKMIAEYLSSPDDNGSNDN